MVRRARTPDLPGINQLLRSYELAPMDASYINGRDIFLFAPSGVEIQGVLWCGLMRKNRSAYVEYFTVSADKAHAGVGKMLAESMARELRKHGVQRVFGIIERDAFHDRSAFNALRMGMKAKATAHTYVFSDVADIFKETGLQ